MPIDIAAMTLADAEGVLAIYAEGLATGEATFETEVPTWAAWDAGHLQDCRLVARVGGTLVGWAALSPVSGRCVYAGVAEVSVYVAAAARGQGVGRAAAPPGGRQRRRGPVDAAGGHLPRECGQPSPPRAVWLSRRGTP